MNKIKFDAFFPMIHATFNYAIYHTMFDHLSEIIEENVHGNFTDLIISVQLQGKYYNRNYYVNDFQYYLDEYFLVDNVFIDMKSIKNTAIYVYDISIDKNDLVQTEILQCLNKNWGLIARKLWNNVKKEFNAYILVTANFIYAEVPIRILMPS